MSKKICYECHEVKLLSAFVGRRTGSRDGRLNKCKMCHARSARRWREKHPDGVGPLARERRRYAVQKGDAKRRRIAFLLTFDEWLKIWTESGHLGESGSFAGQYCMARRGDRGAYEIGNVRICTVEENHREMQHEPYARAMIAESNRRRSRPKDTV